MGIRAIELGDGKGAHDMGGQVAKDNGEGQEARRGRAARRELKDGTGWSGALQSGWRGGLRLIASTIAVTTTVVAAFIALHVVFALFRGNPENMIVSFVATVADTASVAFRDMFQISDARTRTLVNYGISAVIWLLGGRLLAAGVRLLGAVTRR